MLKFYLFLPYISAAAEETFSTVVISLYDIEKNPQNRYLKLYQSTQTQLSCDICPSRQVSKATAMLDTWEKAARNLGESCYRIYHWVNFFLTPIN